MILGYVENKAIGENLSKVLKSDQIGNTRRSRPTHPYRLSGIHLDHQGRHQTRAALPRNRSGKPQVQAEPGTDRAVVGIARRASSRPRPKALARRNRWRRHWPRAAGCCAIFSAKNWSGKNTSIKEGRLFGLYKTFRDQVFHELTLKEFADAFAQMLAYGLFLARLNADEKTKSRSATRAITFPAHSSSSTNWSNS